LLGLYFKGLRSLTSAQLSGSNALPRIHWGPRWFLLRALARPTIAIVATVCPS